MTPDAQPTRTIKQLQALIQARVDDIGELEATFSWAASSGVTRAVNG